MLWNCCIRYANKFYKLSSGHWKTGKSQFSFQSQRRAMPKNAQVPVQLHSIPSKIMLKILQVRLQKYVNRELSDVQAGFRKGRGTRYQIANIHWIMENFCFIDYAKAFDCVDHNKLWNIPEERWIPDHLTCLLRNLYAGQETMVTTGRGTIEWFKIAKTVHQGYILSPVYLTYM